MRGGPLSPCGIRGAAAVLGVLLGLQAARGLPALFAENGPPPGARSPAGSCPEGFSREGLSLEDPSDPFLHGTAGAGIALLAAAAASCAWPAGEGSWSQGVLLPPAVGLGTAVAAAAGKELLDAAGFGRVQGSDFLASACGGLAASAAAALFCSLARRADLDPRVVPLVLGTAGLGLVIPAAGVLARRVSAPRPGPGSGPRPAS